MASEWIVVDHKGSLTGMGRRGPTLWMNLHETNWPDGVCEEA